MWRATAAVSAAVAVVAALAGAAPPPAVPPGTAASVRADDGPLARVVVQARGAGADAAVAVAGAGGTVTRELPIVDGVAATVPAAALAALAATPGLVVTADRPVRVQAATSSSGTESAYRKVV
ncbi:MAG: hypothetical protein ACLGIO_10495, partial [Acidimicrobiia bacterium]